MAYNGILMVPIALVRIDGKRDGLLYNPS